VTLLGERHPFENGRSVGTTASEGGQILLDEEHDAGARMTLERGEQIPFSITCGITARWTTPRTSRRNKRLVAGRASHLPLSRGLLDLPRLWP